MKKVRLKKLPPENKLRREKPMIICNYIYRASLRELIYIWFLVRVKGTPENNYEPKKKKEWYV